MSDVKIQWALALLLVTGCGYAPVYGGAGERMHVKVVRAVAVDAVACDEVASGVRDELARGAALEAGDGYPRVEIEVVRGTEGSEGIADVGGKPLARATEVGLTARAWVVPAEGAARRWDTGDVRAEETVAVDQAAGQLGGGGERSDFFHVPEARRAAARNLGHALARRILGLPVASEASQGNAEP